MRRQTSSLKPLVGKELILAEVDKRFKRETRRIRQHLATAPSREKYIQLERDIVNKILRGSLDDCHDVIVAGQKTRYFHTPRFDWDIDLVKAVRHNYNIYLTGGNINYLEDTLTEKAESRILAVLYYKLEEWLPTQLVKDMTALHNLIKNTDRNREELDRILKECDEGLKTINFSNREYAAIYFLIHTQCRLLFKPGIKFARLQRELDNYFGQDTGGYKPNKVATTATELKHKYLWIDKLFSE